MNPLTLLGLIGLGCSNYEKISERKTRLEDEAKDIPDRVQEGDCVLLREDDGLLAVACREKPSSNVYNKFSVPYYLAKEESWMSGNYPLEVYIDCASNSLTYSADGFCGEKKLVVFANVSECSLEDAQPYPEGFATRLLQAACPDIVLESDGGQEAYYVTSQSCPKF